MDAIAAANASALDAARAPTSVAEDEAEGAFDPTCDQTGTSMNNGILTPSSPRRLLDIPFASPSAPGASTSALADAQEFKIPAPSNEVLGVRESRTRSQTFLTVDKQPSKRRISQVLFASTNQDGAVARSAKTGSSQPLRAAPAAAMIIASSQDVASSRLPSHVPEFKVPDSVPKEDFVPPKRTKMSGCFGDFCVDHALISDYSFASNAAYPNPGVTSFLERLVLAANTSGNTTVYDLANHRYTCTAALNFPKPAAQAFGVNANAMSVWCNAVNRNAWTVNPAVQYTGQIQVNPVPEADISMYRKPTILNARDIGQDLNSHFTIPNNTMAAGFGAVFSNGRHDIWNSTLYARCEIEALKAMRRGRSAQLVTDLLPIGPIAGWADFVDNAPLDDEDMAALNQQAVNRQLTFIVGEDILSTVDLAIVRILCREGHGAAPQQGPVTVVDRATFPEVRPLIIVMRGHELPDIPLAPVVPTAQDFRAFAWRYANNWGQVDAWEAGRHLGAELFASRWQQSPTLDYPVRRNVARRGRIAAHVQIEPPVPRAPFPQIPAANPGFNWLDTINHEDDQIEGIVYEAHPQAPEHQELWDRTTGRAIPNCYVPVRPTLESNSKWFMPMVGSRNVIEHILGIGRKNSDIVHLESATRLHQATSINSDLAAIIYGAIVSSQASASLHDYNLDGTCLSQIIFQMADLPQSINQIANCPSRWSPLPGLQALIGCIYKNNLKEGCQQHYNLRMPNGTYAGQYCFNVGQFEDIYPCAAWPMFFQPHYPPQLGSILSTTSFLAKLPKQYGITARSPKINFAHEVITTGLPVDAGLTPLHGCSQEAHRLASAIEPYIHQAYPALALNVATQKGHLVFAQQDPVLCEDVVACPRTEVSALRGRRAVEHQPPFSQVLAIFQPCTIKSYHHSDNMHAVPAMNSEDNPPQFAQLCPVVETVDPYVGLILPTAGLSLQHQDHSSSHIEEAVRASTAAMKAAVGARAAGLQVEEPKHNKAKGASGGNKTGKSTKKKSHPDKPDNEPDNKDSNFQESEWMLDPLWLLFLKESETAPSLELHDVYDKWRGSTLPTLKVDDIQRAVIQFARGMRGKAFDTKVNKDDQTPHQEQLPEDVSNMYN